jgi:hypothetical protein
MPERAARALADVSGSGLTELGVSWLFGRVKLRARA